MEPQGSVARVFRPVLWLRLPVILAGLFWIGMLVLAVAVDLSLPPHQWVAMGLFIALFVAVALYYWSMRITVDEYAVTYKGLLAFRSYAFDDIIDIRITPVPGMTNYDVRTRFDGLCFTSLISNHEDLLRMIIDRAGLRDKLQRRRLRR